MTKGNGVKPAAAGFGSRLNSLAMAGVDVMSRPLTFLVAFAAALAVTVLSFISGFARSWIGAIATFGPILTLLLIILVQYAQMQNTRAIQLKLDELLAATGGAKKGAIKSERKGAQALDRLEKEGAAAQRKEPRSARRNA